MPDIMHSSIWQLQYFPIISYAHVRMALKFSSSFFREKLEELEYFCQFLPEESEPPRHQNHPRGIDLEREYGEDPLFTPLDLAPVVRKGPISSKKSLKVSSQDPLFEKKK